MGIKKIIKNWATTTYKAPKRPEPRPLGNQQYRAMKKMMSKTRKPSNGIGVGY